MLAGYDRRLIDAWVRLVLFGSPSGLLVLLLVGVWSLLRAPVAGVRRMKVVKEAVYEHLVQPVDVNALAEEVRYSRRQPQLV